MISAVIIVASAWMFGYWFARTNLILQGSAPRIQATLERDAIRGRRILTALRLS